MPYASLGTPSFPTDCVAVLDVGAGRVMLISYRPSGEEFERFQTERWAITPDVVQRFADRLLLEPPSVSALQLVG